MKKLFKHSSAFFAALLVFMFLFYSTAYAQLPDVLYYKFERNPNALTVVNCGLSGTPTAPIAGVTLTPGGQFDSCITGAGVTSSGITTGWNNSLGSSSWTIGMWVDLPTTTFGYLFGDGAGSFRCFNNGAAGTNAITLRGTGITNVNVTGFASGPVYVHFVYDSALANIKVYKNGVLDITVAQTPLNLAAGTGFRVGGYTTSAGFTGKMDEFRLYRRALNQTEITATWNTDIGDCNTPPFVRNFALRLPTPGVNTNYVAIPHQASMIGFTNLTIEAWVKVGSFTTANTILNKGGLSFDYQLGINSTGIPFFRAQGTIATSTGFTVLAGVWTHVAASYDGTNVRFYKDGALTSTIPMTTLPGSSSNEMRIGRGNADPGSGNLEEVRLWSVARTQGAIDSNKCRKYPGLFSSSAGLKALWHLDSNLIDSISGFNGNPMGNIGFDTVSFPIPGANCNLVGIEPLAGNIPQVYSLSQNYPNPFNPSTIIEFSIPKGGFVELKIYDLLGREVSTLVQDPFEAGTYRINFNSGGLASGVYFYSIVSGDFKDTKKMLLVK